MNFITVKGKITHGGSTYGDRTAWPEVARSSRDATGGGRSGRGMAKGGEE